MLHLTSVDLKKSKTEAFVILVCEDANIYENFAIAALIKKAKKLKEFKGEKDDELILYNIPETGATRTLFMGLGKLEKIDPETLRSMTGKAIKKCIEKDLSNVLISVPLAKKIKIEAPLLLGALFEGAYLGNHLFDKFKEKKKHKPLKKINFFVKQDMAKQFKTLPARVETLCEGTILAREWVSTPSNLKKPEQFAKSIAALAAKQSLKVSVFDEKELKAKKFGAIIAVAKGSTSKPRMVVLEYYPQRKKKTKTVALIGKGVTFDSGGINLKSSASMDEMKVDMSGAAAVAATLITVAKMRSDIRAIGIIPVVENMPSGSAFRPGDIIKSYSGKTIEIGNTDAEGRLILADAISYAIKKYKPHTIIDVATLTGACVVALGEKIAGLFSSDDELAKAIVRSGETTHERCWRMPMPDDYKDQLKSSIADIRNLGNTRWGGAITAALFLAEFAEHTRWAHIDIAGPAYVKKDNAYCDAGGTGFGVRLLCNFLEKL